MLTIVYNEKGGRLSKSLFTFLALPPKNSAMKWIKFTKPYYLRLIDFLLFYIRLTNSIKYFRMNLIS